MTFDQALDRFPLCLAGDQKFAAAKDAEGLRRLAQTAYDEWKDGVRQFDENEGRRIETFLLLFPATRKVEA